MCGGEGGESRGNRKERRLGSCMHGGGDAGRTKPSICMCFFLHESIKEITKASEGNSHQSAGIICSFFSRPPIFPQQQPSVSVSVPVECGQLDLQLTSITGR